MKKYIVISGVIGALIGFIISYKKHTVEPEVLIQNFSAFTSAKGKVEASRDGQWIKLSFNEKEKMNDVWAAAQVNVQLDPKKRYEVNFRIQFDKIGRTIFFTSDRNWEQRSYHQNLVLSGSHGQIVVGRSGPITFVLESPGTVWIKDVVVKEVK